MSDAPGMRRLAPQELPLLCVIRHPSNPNRWWLVEGVVLDCVILPNAEGAHSKLSIYDLVEGGFEWTNAAGVPRGDLEPRGRDLPVPDGWHKFEVPA